ncbi:hypothetical protein DEO72_LG11g1504 [Vigna unguiculata]|uniref:Sugar phosphate transporter domain-containing protein n=1 Tax=Vigna unguiculata TaxID=3917 RepID=A0A4D6NL23_VIGUN|nr:hypothetical protein DEO72_LG11g1504 [Vigna unguiculata]
MQSAAFTLSPSLSLPLRNTSLNASRPSLPVRLFAKHTEGVNSNGASSTSFLRRSWTLSSSSSFKFRPLPPSPPRAAENAVPDSAPAENSLFKTLELGSLFGLWYLFNIYFNIYNKQVLKAFHFPVTVTVVQFAVGTVLVAFMWGLNLYKRPKISGAMLGAILPLAVVHTLGNLFTNMSLGKVAVSFTHTIKAMEPFFSVVLSAMFLGEDSMDNITLFSIITVMSFFLLAPVAVFMEGVKFTPAYLQSAGLNVKQLYIRSLLAALCFHAYQQVSYMILQRVSPVTHSVGNCVKRVVVIVSSVIFFQTPVSPVNAFGTAIALAGVFLYSRVKRIKSKPKTA